MSTGVQSAFSYILTGASVFSPPAIAYDPIHAHGVVCIGSKDKNLYCIDTTSRQVMNFTAMNPIITSPAIWPDGAVYFGDFGGNIYAVQGSRFLPA